jgi:hypothetical protein
MERRGRQVRPERTTESLSIVAPVFRPRGSWAFSEA